MKLKRYGDQAWLVETDDPPALAAIALPGVEFVPAASTCLIRFAGPAPDRSTMEQLLATWTAKAPLSTSQPEIEIPVRYDGPDLSAVAAAAGLSEREVVALHRDTAYRVAFLGFAPGFGYLSELPTRLQLPRRSVPRIAVGAGAVAIADRYTAVYPRSSPGGWHLIGHTMTKLFDPGRDSPSLLTAGVTVRFREIS